jgi:hypothetical protein
MSVTTKIQTALESVIGVYKTRVTAQSLSFSELLTLAYNATATFVRIVESLGKEMDGKTKKEIVLLAIGNFYDLVIRPIKITGLPAAMENAVDDAIKNFVLMAAGAWIDAMVNIFSKLGWFKSTDESDISKIVEFEIF